MMSTGQAQDLRNRIPMANRMMYKFLISSSHKILIPLMSKLAFRNPAVSSFMSTL